MRSRSGPVGAMHRVRGFRRQESASYRFRCSASQALGKDVSIYFGPWPLLPKSAKSAESAVSNSEFRFKSFLSRNELVAPAWREFCGLDCARKPRNQICAEHRPQAEGLSKR